MGDVDDDVLSIYEAIDGKLIWGAKALEPFCDDLSEPTTALGQNSNPYWQNILSSLGPRAAQNVGWNSHTRDRPADCLRSQTHLAAKIGCSWRSAKGPYQIISNSLGFIALHDILKCLSKEDCGVSKDIITVTEEGHLGKHHSTHPSPTLPPVEIQIAVRNLFVDREIASVEKTAARTRCFEDNIYHSAVSELLGFYRGFEMEKPNRDLQVHTRMALLSEVEQEAFEQVRRSGERLMWTMG
jgi:hypothetical protein